MPLCPGPAIVSVASSVAHTGGITGSITVRVSCACTPHAHIPTTAKPSTAIRFIANAPRYQTILQSHTKSMGVSGQSICRSLLPAYCLLLRQLVHLARGQQEPAHPKH